MYSHVSQKSHKAGFDSDEYLFSYLVPWYLMQSGSNKTLLE